MPEYLPRTIKFPNCDHRYNLGILNSVEFVIAKTKFLNRPPICRTCHPENNKKPVQLKK